MSESASDIVCFKSPAYEAVPRKPPVYDYVSVNDVQSKSSLGGSHYTELGPRPLDTPAILPELGGKKVLYSDVKHTVSCAELADCHFRMHQTSLPLEILQAISVVT